MNIYKQKQTWKILLFTGAIVIILGSLWYTNFLAGKISGEEKSKIKLWAEAIQKKAKLVNYTEDLFEKLRTEELKKVQLWALGTKQIANPDIDFSSLSFVLEVIRNNTTVPVIITDESGKVLFHRNLDSLQVNNPDYIKNELMEMHQRNKAIEIEVTKNQKQYLYYKDSKLFTDLQQTLNDIIESFVSEIVLNSASVPVILTDETQKEIIAFGNLDSIKMKDKTYVEKTINEMRLQKEPISLQLTNNTTNFIFYKDSQLLMQLKYYPYIQMGIIGLFLIIAYSLFSYSRRAEQNQVWVGMSKETAHQLGTPLSSLMAWIDILKEKNTLPEIADEMEKDVLRLNTITERFSKIGSAPKLVNEDITEVVKSGLAYLENRVSKKVKFTYHFPQETIMVPLNIPLFHWVIENLIKNAVDSMEGVGELIVTVTQVPEQVYIDITDTGKGIPKSKHQSVFKPGYTTKKRGWGLGLSLAKRIIEEYHQGKIFVKQSEVNIGTTFRIILNS